MTAAEKPCLHVVSAQNQPVSFHVWMHQVQNTMEAALAAFLPADSHPPARLHQAMRYAVLEGGKRIRPLLVFAAAELFDAPSSVVQRAAVAIEMIHAYSLVHDDMPCMDNDVLRRGKPTVHRQYDEATALLAGDALQSQAFIVLSRMQNDIVPDAQIMQLRLLAQAAGSQGMCGGQAIDLASVGINLSLSELELMHKLKTGALLRAAVMLGAWSGKVLSSAEIQALETYSNAIGLAFQVVDDMLDATSDSSTLGKTAGKDAAAHKPTYVSIIGLAASQTLVEKLRDDAHTAIAPFGSKAQRLHELAELIVQRKA